MISFIVPFCGTNSNLFEWGNVNSSTIEYTTILAIKNINRMTEGRDIEIILVDNSNSFPKLKMPNLKIVEGLQYKKEEDISTDEKIKYNIIDMNDHTMWASAAYNFGIKHAKGDYIILQHNDVFYHQDLFSSIIELLDTNEYVSVDSKKISLTGYLGNKELFDNLGIDTTIGYEDGGHLKTKIGMADAYFFACKKEFFDDYIVDYGYGDTNHGATIKCILQDKPYYHIGPYYENPNFEAPNKKNHEYKLNNKPFLTHLKGGFSEGKFSWRVNDELNKRSQVSEYMKEIGKYI